MNKPVVGVIGNGHSLEPRFQVQMTGEANMAALARVTDALPLVFAGDPDISDIGALLDAVDGIVLTGARANVHPTRFDTEPDVAYEPYDERRDELALNLSRICLEQGVPIFGICRGMQELNVAFGGFLYPEIRDLPGRIKHRMPRLENGFVSQMLYDRDSRRDSIMVAVWNERLDPDDIEDPELVCLSSLPEAARLPCDPV